VKSFKSLAGLTLLAIGLTSCQTESKIRPHFDGNRYRRLNSPESVELRKLSFKQKWDQHLADMAKQGYSFVGKAFFVGIQASVEEVKSFAASVGADLVEGVAYPAGTVTQTYMGVGSYTPGRTVTSFGNSSAYTTGSTAGSIMGPYGSIPFTAQSSGSSYGTGATTTYIPSEITYVPRSYQMPVTSQNYLFWLSPRGYLRNWMDLRRDSNSTNSAGETVTTENAKIMAAIFAQANNVPLPKDLQPKNPLPRLDPALLEKVRESQVEAVSRKKGQK
jgi:hypothetical protein